MKADLLQRARISRYSGSFPSFSSFRLCPCPWVEDSETNEIHAKGTVTKTDDTLRIDYRETESGIAVTLEKRGDLLRIVRGGGELVFEKSKHTAFTYRTPYGEFSTEAYTEEMSLQEKGKQLLLLLVYTAVFGGMAQKNEMRIKVTLKD